MPRRNGFTLIELLIVIVIIGLLAVVAMPFLWKTKDRALVASMKQDLKILANHQEIYFSKNLIYADDPALIADFQASTGVTITVNYAQTDGWAAVATHAGVPSQCGLFMGNALAADAAPATQAGVVECN
jgi:prepilin-type N-terminal cleavage/methylation domain-containing protein